MGDPMSLSTTESSMRSSRSRDVACPSRRADSAAATSLAYDVPTAVATSLA